MYSPFDIQKGGKDGTSSTVSITVTGFGFSADSTLSQIEKHGAAVTARIPNLGKTPQERVAGVRQNDTVAQLEAVKGLADAAIGGVQEATPATNLTANAVVGIPQNGGLGASV